jgi:hypothetical protein
MLVGDGGFQTPWDSGLNPKLSIGKAQNFVILQDRDDFWGFTFWIQILTL